jgi:hypothetical protein
LVVQDETSDGQQSNFNKLVSRNNVEDHSAESSDRTSAKRSRKSTQGTHDSTAGASRAATSSRKKSNSAASTKKERPRTEHTDRSSKKKAA